MIFLRYFFIHENKYTRFFKFCVIVFNMKKALKDKKIYIIASILAVIGYIPLAIGGILSIPSLNSDGFFGYPYVIWAIIALYFLIGFIWSDLYKANVRRKTKNWDNKLDEEVIVSSWKRCLPFYFACLAILIMALVLELYHAILGFYPFLG